MRAAGEDLPLVPFRSEAESGLDAARRQGESGGARPELTQGTARVLPGSRCCSEAARRARQGA